MIEEEKWHDECEPLRFVMKILLVEDDEPTAGVLSEVLTAQYYTVELATDGQLGLDFATTEEFDLILLDLLIPKLDGINLCRQLRAQGYQKPILLLTAKDSSADVVKGLDAGADDYVTKPYNLSELLARIRALLRRGETNITPSLLTWGNLCVNPVSAEVTYDGTVVSLTPKEYGLLGLFLRNPQRVFSRSDIIERLWSIDTSPSESAVTNLIKDLRQKLKSFGMTTDLLETVYGLGYRLKPPPPSPAPIDGGSGVNAKLKEPVGSEHQAKAKRPKDLTSIQKVLKQYQATFAARVAILEQVEQAWQAGEPDQALQQRGAQEAHRLAGALGSFGYDSGSELARLIEHLLTQSTPLQPAHISRLSTLVSSLRQELTKPPKPFPAQLLEGTPLPFILAIDPEVRFTDQLQQAASAWRLQVESVPDFTVAQPRLAKRTPDAVLFSLPNMADDQAAALETFRQQFPHVPVVVLMAQDSLDDRVIASRLGVQRFLYKPISIAAVFEALTQALPKTQPAEATVMILDDDEIVLHTLRELLQPWGLQVRTLQDPKQFWDVLTATVPDLLLMDLEMPTFNGIDLCRVVRQDPKWGNLPILVVTAHTDMASIQQVFAAGADDFISKPVVGPELVTRVISRIDRSRLQQELETMKRRIGTYDNA
jgi:DNA-binding response OmpR family regulator